MILENIQKANRIYATKDTSLGTIYKIKKNVKYKVDTTKRNWEKGLTQEQVNSVINKGYYVKDKFDKLANAPEHCLIDNDNKISIDNIDKDYYIDMAYDRIAKYIGGELIMATKKTETAVTAPNIVLEQVPNTPEAQRTSNLWKKITLLSKYFDREAPKFVKDGYNAGQKYEYVKAHQYKTALRKGLLECGLGIKINLLDYSKVELSNPSSTMTNICFRGQVVLVDIDTGEATAYNCLALGADSLDKQASKAETLLIKDFVKNNFLVDDNEDETDPEADIKPVQVVTKPSIPVTPEKREVIKEKVVEQATSPSNIPESTINYAIGLVNKIREKSGNPNEASKLLATITEKDANGQYTIDSLDLKRKINILEERADVLGIKE